MVLVEDMVSRKHAKISANGDQIFIQDFGSTNGTFVNGEKVKRARLREGDRILIGTSIIKLVKLDSAAAEKASMPTPAPEIETSANVPEAGPKRTVASARSMAGTIDEIPLPDLLQLLSTSKKSGVLEIHAEHYVGRIYLRKGQIYYATIDDSFELNPYKAIYRILTWLSGSFELLPPDEKTFMNELDEPTDGLLLEAMRQLDELGRLREEMPALTANLAISKPLLTPLRELTPEQLDVLQAVHNAGDVKQTLDKCSLSDLDVVTHLVELIKKNVVTVE